jgi:hypothetical protein
LGRESVAVSHEELLDLIASVKQGPTADDGDLPSLVIGLGDDRWWLDEEGHVLLTELSNRLAGEAVREAGLSPRAARERLIRLCSESIAMDWEAAVAALEASIAAPLRDWTVFKPHRIAFPGDAFDIARCRLLKALPPEVTGIPGLEDDFPAFSISTSVKAHDSDAAIILAHKAMSEAFAIMQLVSSEHRAYLGRPVLVLKDDGEVILTPSAVPDLYLGPLASGPGELRASVRPLSEAAAKDPSARTEWERRSLAAARWLSKGIASTWPSDSLVSYMVALETLFVRDRTINNKGETVARGVSALMRFRDFTEDQQIDWLRSLYARRNDAVHEARDY